MAARSRRFFQSNDALIWELATHGARGAETDILVNNVGMGSRRARRSIMLMQSCPAHAASPAQPSANKGPEMGPGQTQPSPVSRPNGSLVGIPRILPAEGGSTGSSETEGKK